MTGAARSILVVDDDDDIRETVRWVLESSGYSVRTAADGQAAWETLDADGSAVSLILLDLMMPIMNGPQFMSQLTASRHAAVPVVVMSGHHAGRETAEQIGAAGCLVKPVELETLLDVVYQFSGRAVP